MKVKKIAVCILLVGWLVGCSHTGKPYIYEQKNSEQVNFEGYQLSNRTMVNDQSYYFDYDSFSVAKGDLDSLKLQGDYLLKHPKAKIRLEGNTDERGTREYNIALGWKRARAVASYLINLGVKQDQLAIVSFGKEKPIDNGHNETAYAKNRRVDLIYETK